LDGCTHRKDAARRRVITNSTATNARGVMSEDVRVIKKYPNRRLYDTATSSYITLADVKKLVLENIAFKVEDAKSHEDLTRSILLQIILEEESAQGAPMFSCDMLTNIIRFYGNAMQGMMGNYLDKNIQTFMEIQKRLQEQSQGIFSNGAQQPPNATAVSYTHLTLPTSP
jgi:polyhydroxyalkanoate synthesis repressor PhaR